MELIHTHNIIAMPMKHKRKVHGGHWPKICGACPLMLELFD